MNRIFCHYTDTYTTELMYLLNNFNGNENIFRINSSYREVWPWFRNSLTSVWRGSDVTNNYYLRVPTLTGIAAAIEGITFLPKDWILLFRQTSYPIHTRSLVFNCLGFFSLKAILKFELFMFNSQAKQKAPFLLSVIDRPSCLVCLNATDRTKYGIRGTRAGHKTKHKN